MSSYTEDTLVQQTTADYLEQQLGWESVYAYNNEDFGPNSLLGRTSDREVVLTRILREKLAELNPGLPDDAYDDAVRQITATVASQTLIATNREKYAMIRDGVQVTFRNDKGERVRQRLRLFDFDEPDEQPLSLRARAVGAGRPLPPSRRHHRFRQRHPAAVHGVQEHSSGTSRPPSSRTSPTTRTRSRTSSTTTPS